VTPQEEALHPDTPPARLWELAVSHYEESFVNLLLISIKPTKKIAVIKVLRNFSRATLYTAKKWTDDMPCFINRRGLRREDAEKVQAAVRAEGGEIELRPRATPTSYAALVTQNPSIPTDLLWALGACEDAEIRAAVCRHPLTPMPLLFFLGAEFPQEFLQNPSIQLTLLENPTAFHSWPEQIKLSILSSSELGEDTLREFLQKSSFRERRAAFMHPSLSASLLDELSRHPSTDIRQDLAASPRASTEILARLAQDPNIYVRGAVASNPNTPLDILQQMHGVEGQLAQNPSAPTALLLELAQTGNEEVLFHLQRRGSLPPEALDILARSERESVRIVAASHQNTKQETLEQLSHDDKDAVLSAIAKNKATPSEILERLIHKGDNWLVADVACNENVPEHLFPEIVRLLKDTGLKEALLQNPRLPEALCLQQLDVMPLHIKRMYASSATAIGMLANLARDPNREVRVAVAQNPNTSHEILERLLQDPDPSIRQQVTLRYQPYIPWD
jgi:hypothetical protein